LHSDVIMPLKLREMFKQEDEAAAMMEFVF
jgi:hypothetical protein